MSAYGRVGVYRGMRSVSPYYPKQARLSTRPTTRTYADSATRPHADTLCADTPTRSPHADTFPPVDIYPALLKLWEV